METLTKRGLDPTEVLHARTSALEGDLWSKHVVRYG